jgi:hypothetical protein
MGSTILGYQPLLKILDEKGQIIDDFQKKVFGKFPSWQLVNSDILFTEKAESPQNELFVGLRRMSFILEDIPTYESYYNDAINYCKFFHEYFKLSAFERVGFRIISTYTSEKIHDFDGYLRVLEDRFLKDPLSLGLKHKDLFLKVDHGNGFYVVGPIKQKEPWIMSNFKETGDLTKIPKHGIGIDIDSFGLNFEVKNGKELISKIDSTIKLSKSIEDALLKSLEF